MLSVTASASRISGVAPLAVFFEAVAQSSLIRPFHDIAYGWKFGDSSAPWSYGSQVGGPGVNDKNSASGPVAAHVFEKPGTYTVCLTAFDGKYMAETAVQITVTDFAASNTVCIANGAVPSPGVDAGCPAGATAVGNMTSWPAVVSTYLSGTKGTNKKILLKRGDVFTGAANTNIAATGPAMIGAFGSGSKPVIRGTSTGSLNKFMSAVGTLSDVRLVDLDVDGQNNAFSQGISGTSSLISNLAVLRVDFHDIGTAISIAISEVAAFPDSVFIVDSSMRNMIGGGGNEGIFASASRFAIIGNHIDNTLLAEHLLRIPNADRAVVSNNTFERSKSDKEMMSLRSICTAPCASGTYRPDLGLTGSAAWTKKVLISNNLFNTSSYTGIHAVPNGEHANKTTEDVIIENNFFRTMPGVAGAAVLLSRTNKVTVRNNIANLGTYGTAFSATEVPDAGASDIFIYNNTIFSSVSGNKIIGLATDDLLTNLVMRNNALYAPNADGNSRAVGIPGGLPSANTIQSNNTADGSQIVTAPGPSFVNASGSFSLPSDFKLSSGSYAIGKGVSVPVFTDFFGVTTRPQISGIDIGATEQ